MGDVHFLFKHGISRSGKVFLFLPSNLFILTLGFGLGLLLSKWELSSGSSNAHIVRCCGPGCRQRSGIRDYYNKKYFSWQIPYGKGRSRERDWNKFINAQPNSTVADLGAGGGFTLSTLNVKRKIAIEVNDVARDYIRSNFPDIEAYKYPEDVPDFESIDILLSIDAVEHMECPITELKEMEKKVRPGGRLLVTVKNEGVGFAVPAVDNDIHQHFYTWSPQNLHNFVKAAGFKMQGVTPSVRQMNATFNGWTQETFATTLACFHLWAWGTK